MASPPRQIPPTTYATLTSVITVALARHQRLDVLASADVRRAVELEGDKRALGCDENTSCLAEVAGAMGARLVVFGQLGDLDGELVMTLNLFDSQTASAAGRVLERASDARLLSGKVDAAVDRLVGSTLASIKGTDRVRILVLDLVPGTTQDEQAAATSNVARDPSAGPAAAGSPWLLYGAAGTAGAALLVAGTGAILGGVHVAEIEAGNAEPLAAAALKHDEAAQQFGLWANASFIVSAGLLAVSAGLATASVVMGEAE